MRARLDVHSHDVYCPACRSEYPEGWKRCPTDEAQLLRGPTVGKYKIDRVIGQGGMGAVYRAENPDTRAEVAVKLLHGGSAGVEQARTRFQREAAAVAALRTRHVVSIFDFGSEGDARRIGEAYPGFEIAGHSAPIGCSDTGGKREGSRWLLAASGCCR